MEFKKELLEEVRELLEMFSRSDASSVCLQAGDLRLEWQRSGSAAPAPASAPAAQAEQAAPAAAPEPGDLLTAPLVGTFYAAPAPGEAPFVTAGQTVRKGETICLIEAMKMMSEVPAPCDLIVLEVLKENATLVSYGEPVLRYRPC